MIETLSPFCAAVQKHNTLQVLPFANYLCHFNTTKILARHQVAHTISVNWWQLTCLNYNLWQRRKQWMKTRSCQLNVFYTHLCFALSEFVCCRFFSPHSHTQFSSACSRTHCCSEGGKRRQEERKVSTATPAGRGGQTQQSTVKQRSWIWSALLKYTWYWASGLKIKDFLLLLLLLSYTQKNIAIKYAMKFLSWDTSSLYNKQQWKGKINKLGIM